LPSQSRVFCFNNLPLKKAAGERKRMKKNNQKVPTQFAPEMRFNVAPLLAQPFRVTQETEFEKLKNRLLRRLLDDAVQPELNVPLRRAVNDAAALAWTTLFPLLVFPGLLEEKARSARLQLQKQKQVRLRSETLLVEAA
jgi:hypothetical protein